MTDLRLFIASRPSPDAVAALMSLQRKSTRGVRFVAPENWHVTMRFLGESDPGEVIEAMARASLPATHARMGPGVDVLHTRTLVVPVAGVESLAAAVIAATRGIGEPVPRRSFFGHVTIARLARGARMPRVLGESLHAEWNVDDVELIVSRLHPDGARYETIHTWPIPLQ